MTTQKKAFAGDLLLLQDRMNRVFEESLRESGISRDPGQWVPHVDMFEDDASVVIKAELPGVKRDDISLDISDGVISISGKKPLEHEEIAENFHVVERQYGFFKRSLPLPGTVDLNSVEASYHSGVLEITLTKPTDSRSRRITIIRECD